MKNFKRTRDGKVGGGVNVAAAAANVTLTIRSARHQILTPDAARNVTLPALASSKGLPFIIKNADAAGFNLTVKNPAGTTLAVLKPGQAGLFACNATVWAAVIIGVSATPGAALTAALTALTHTAPGTPDYALQDLVQNTGFGFATKDEGNTALSVLVRVAARVAEIEARLLAANLIS